MGIIILAIINLQPFVIKDSSTDEILWISRSLTGKIKDCANPFFQMETLTMIAEWTPDGQAMCEYDLDHNGMGEITNSLWHDTARVYECVGDDSFQLIYTYPCPDVYYPNTYYTSLKAAGDADSDNKGELIFTSGTSGVPREIVFVEAQDSLSFPDTIVLRLREDSIGINHMKIDDLDKDNKKECIGTTQGTHVLVLAIWENIGDDSFKMVWSTNFGQSNRPAGQFSYGCDFDYDGYPEMVVPVATAPSHVYVVENRGDDQYTISWDQEYPSDNAFWACLGPDLDSDSKRDFVVLGARGAAPSTWTCIMYECVQDDSFAPVWRYDVNSGWIHGGVATGDINGDGLNELLLQVQGGTYLFKGAGDDSLELIWTNNLPVKGQGEHRMITHDLDYDQKGEIAFYTSQTPVRTVVFEKYGPVQVAEQIKPSATTSFLIYPNPISNKATIEYNGAFNLPVELDILDVQGRLVHRIELKKRKSTVDLSRLSNGIYFTILRSKNSSTAERIVKVR